MGKKILRIDLTEKQIEKIKRKLLEPNNIKLNSGKKRFGLFAQPNMCTETLSIRLLNVKEFNVINKACIKIGYKKS